MVNVENIQKVIERISDEENFFNMYDFEVNETIIKRYIKEGDKVPECGTASCIGGHIARVMGKSNSHNTSVKTLGEFIGIDEQKAEKLFYPSPRAFGMGVITRADAITTLENLVLTGEVKWPFAVFNNSDDEPEQEDDNEL